MTWAIVQRERVALRAVEALRTLKTALRPKRPASPAGLPDDAATR